MKLQWRSLRMITIVNGNVRNFSILLGIGLAIVWLCGLNSAIAPAWLVWLDGVAGLLAFSLAGAIRPSTGIGGVTFGPLALALGLFALWMVGLATGSVAWLTWWTFAFACAFLIMGFAANHARRTLARQLHGEAPQEGLRRSA